MVSAEKEIFNATFQILKDFKIACKKIFLLPPKTNFHHNKRLKKRRRK